MSVPLANLDIIYDGALCGETHDIMCMIKRPAYELTFTVPHSPHASAHGAQLHLYIRSKPTGEPRGFVFDLADTKQFYADLLRILEYMQNECPKIGALQPS